MNPPVIIGAGLAGFSVALAMAPAPVIVIGRKMASGHTSSELAQGGIAAAIGADDNPELHWQDTLAAGAGLCDGEIVRMITAAGPAAIEQLAQWGVEFDRDDTGALKTSLEGAHCRRRVVHAHGDSTGAAIMQALVERVRTTPSITLIDDAEVTKITTGEEGVTGVLFHHAGQEKETYIETRHVVLATGSACALWRHATVPLGSWGHGLALAAQAGARLRDLEFVQFHPTALAVGSDPMPLISEALRGEGARLVNESGNHFIDELAPRDVVARAIWAEIEKGQHVFLDARHLANFAARFPTIFEACRAAGIDPTCVLIPVRPVAHYHMGGVATDAHGRTNVSGLWACGEGACTGLHGANRLASNSLLEAVVMGQRVAEDLSEFVMEQLKMNQTETCHSGQAEHRRCEARAGTPFSFVFQEKSNGVPDQLSFAQVGEEKVFRNDESIFTAVRDLMETYVGVRRDKDGLEKAMAALQSMATLSRPALVGLMIAKAALSRTESRGGHMRTDYPALDPLQARPQYVRLTDGEVIVEQESK